MCAAFGPTPSCGTAQSQKIQEATRRLNPVRCCAAAPVHPSSSSSKPIGQRVSTGGGERGGGCGQDEGERAGTGVGQPDVGKDTSIPTTAKARAIQVAASQPAASHPELGVPIPASKDTDATHFRLGSGGASLWIDAHGLKQWHMTLGTPATADGVSKGWSGVSHWRLNLSTRRDKPAPAKPLLLCVEIGRSKRW